MATIALGSPSVYNERVESPSNQWESDIKFPAGSLTIEKELYLHQSADEKYGLKAFQETCFWSQYKCFFKIQTVTGS